MSAPGSAEMQRAAMQHECLNCGARPGEWCRTMRGGYAAQLHSNRFYSAKRAASGVAE